MAHLRGIAALTCAAAVVLAAAGAEARTDWRLKVTAGPEFDSNALRNPSGNQAVFPVTPDWDLRVLALAGLNWTDDAREQLLHAEYLVGGKLFVRQDEEDALTNQVDLSYQHRVDELFWPGVELSFKDLTLNGSARDYALVTAAAFADLPLWPGGVLRPRAGYRAFVYKPDGSYDNKGPLAGLMVRQRVVKRLGVYLSYEFQDRGYEGKAWRLVPDIAGAVKIIRSGEARADATHTLSAGVEFHRGVLLSGGYTLVYNASDSVGESIVRHRVMLLASAKPIWDVYVHLIGAVQWTTFTDGLFVSQQLFLEEDDENQNSLTAKLSREIAYRVSAELKYSLYVSEFSSGGLSFTRQVYFAGVSWKYD